jgi:RNA polymerase sigma factor
VQQLQKLREVLRDILGQEPTDEQWASAAKLDKQTLKRQLLLSRAARNKLIQHNLRLVLSQAHKYYKGNMSFSLHDLCQEGVLGLMHSVDKFDPTKGYRFSTYAVYWIRNSILRAQTKSGHMVRSPINVSMQKVNIKRAKLDLALELGRNPTSKEVMQRLGLGVDRYHDILRTTMRTTSLHLRDRITGEEKVEILADTDNASSMMLGGRNMLRVGMDDVVSHFLCTFAPFTQQLRMLPACECRCVS